MNRCPSPPAASMTPKRGVLGWLLTSLAVALADYVDWTQIAPRHMGGERGVSFGTHSVQVGNLITMDTQAPSAMGQIGMDASTGRIQQYVGGAARAVPGSHEVLALSGGTMAGAIAMGSSKITGLGNGSTGTQDAATVAQMETYVGNLIAPKANVGSAGQGLIGKGSITAINGLTPATGNVVIATDGGTPSAGTSDLLAAGDVAEYDGTSWKKIVANSGGYPPEGTRILVSTTTGFISSSGLTGSQDEGKIANFDGTALTPASFTTPTDGVLVAIRGEGATAENKVLAFDGTVPTGVWRDTAAAGVGHSTLTGLTSGDDHTQYGLLAGRSGGQTLVGGTGAGESLTLESTSNGTKGSIALASGTSMAMMGDDYFNPNTSGQGQLGKSTKKFKAVYALNVYTGDLHLANPDGDPRKAWRLVETPTGLEATNQGTGQVHDVLMVRRGSVLGAICRLLG